MGPRLQRMVACLLSLGSLALAEPTWANESHTASGLSLQAAVELEQTARLLAILLDSGRAVVNDNQARLDDPHTADKGFTPDVFERQLIDMFQVRAGINIRELPMAKLTARTKHLLRELLVASKDVVAGVQQDINRRGIGYKGFIPAVFGERAAARFSAKTGVRLKQTSLTPRNPANRPDGYEQMALDAFAKPAYPREQVISDLATDSGSLRLMFPLYTTRQCLDCHGEPKGNLDRTGYPREGLVLGQNAGAISVLLPVTR